MKDVKEIAANEKVFVAERMIDGIAGYVDLRATKKRATRMVSD